MLEYKVTAKRLDQHGSSARCKDAELVLDTDVNGRPDAFNPAELFLAAIAACMIKGIERATPMLKFNLRGVEVRLHNIRHIAPRAGNSGAIGRGRTETEFARERMADLPGYL